GDAAATGVDGDDDAATVGREHRVEELRVAVSRGADDYAVCAGLQQRGDAFRVAQAAAGLNPTIDRRRDPADRLQVRRPAVAGTVEVDDVEKTGALRCPAPRGVDRIGV